MMDEEEEEEEEGQKRKAANSIFETKYSGNCI